MKKLRVMDSSGDSGGIPGRPPLEFDDTEATATVRAEANALFERLTGAGAVTFAVNRGGAEPDKRVTDFNDLEAENIIVPRIVGG